MSDQSIGKSKKLDALNLKNMNTGTNITSYTDRDTVVQEFSYLDHSVVENYSPASKRAQEQDDESIIKFLMQQLTDAKKNEKDKTLEIEDLIRKNNDILKEEKERREYYIKVHGEVVKRLEGEIAELREANEKLEKDNLVLNSHKEKLSEFSQKNEEETNHKMEELKNTYESKLTKLRQLNEECVSKLNIEREEFKIATNKLEEELKLLKGVNEKQKSEKKEYEDKIKNLNQDIEKLQSQLEMKENEWNYKFNKEVKNWQDKLVLLENDMKLNAIEEKNKWALIVSKKDSEIKELKESIEKKSGTDSVLKESNKKLEEANKNLEIIVNDYSAKLKAKESEISNFENQIQASKSELAEKEKKINELSVNIKILENSNNNLNSDLSKIKAEYQEKLDHLNEKFKIERKDLISRIESLEQHVTEIEKQKNVAIKQNEMDSENRDKSSQEKIAQLENTLKKLEEKLKAEESNRDNLANQLNLATASQNESSKLKAELDNITKIYEELKSRNELIEKKFEGLQSYSKSEIAKLNKQSELDRETILALQNRLASYEEINTSRDVEMKRLKYQAAFRDSFLRLKADTIQNETIMKYTQETPSSVTVTAQKLSDYLSKVINSDIEKAWIIYLWISLNIAYDIDGFVQGKDTSSSAEAILKSRKGLSFGYSDLYYTMAIKMGLECKIIEGYAKGYGYEKDKEFADADHSWNAVKIGDIWYLIDVTWGAGFINSKKEFQFELNPFYFLTPPSQFITNHYPVEKEWQLIDTPLSIDEYVRAMEYKDFFFKYGLELLNHKTQIITLDDNELSISVKGSRNILMLAYIEKDGQKFENLTFIQHEDGINLIESCYPSAGLYKLKIFAKEVNEKGNYHIVLEFTINVKNSSKKQLGFPSLFSTFTERKCFLVEPKKGYLKPNKLQRFKIRVPEALQVAVVIDKKWNYLNKKEKESDVHEGELKIEGNMVAIYAKYPEAKNFDGLLKYQVV